MLEELLNDLSKKTYRIGNNSELDSADSDVKAVKENCIVILPAGGLGSRLDSVTQGTNTHKTSYRLPNGETMIERTIKMYRDAGVVDFVALIFHNGESIVQLLGDGSAMQTHIQYSVDPDKPVGRGGAIYHALVQGILPQDRYMIVHNPDDQIVENADTFVDDIVRAHLLAEKQKALATIIAADGSAYSFTGMVIDNNAVVDIQVYPFVPIPFHIGVTVFSPQISEYFLRLFNVKEQIDFESVLFPQLVKEGKLSAKVIPHTAHIAVNDTKNFKQLLKALSL